MDTYTTNDLHAARGHFAHLLAQLEATAAMARRIGYEQPDDPLVTEEYMTRVALAAIDAEIARRRQPVQLPLPDPCPACRGSGIASEYNWTNDTPPQGWDCPACQGSGIVLVREAAL